MWLILKGILQIGLLSLLSISGDYIAAWLHLRVPGSIIGLFVLFLLLQLRALSLTWVEFGSTWLLAELLLFFIPSAVGVIQYKQLIEVNGLKFLAVTALSTIIVMLVAGLSTELMQRYVKRQE